MKSHVLSILSKALLSFIEEKQIKEMIDQTNIVSIGNEYCLFHPDIARKLIESIVQQKIIDKKEAISITDSILNQVVNEAKRCGFVIICSYLVILQNGLCNDCPAYQWVLHRKGIHSCRLFVDINETVTENGMYTAHPIKECIRPLSCGASYLIAEELGLPEPMVGKLDKQQYVQYLKEKEQLCL